MVNKLSLNGFGRIGRIVLTTDCYEMKNSVRTDVPEYLNNNDLILNVNKAHNSLIDIYKKVQRKYYPEKDLFVSKTLNRKNIL